MPAQPAQPQDSGRLVLVILLLFWLMATPDNGPVMISGPSFASSRLQRQRQAHGVLNSTKWGDFAPRLVDDGPGTVPRYLNLTGFRQDDGYGWEDFGKFRDRCREWSSNAFSGRVGGDDWNRPGPSQLPWRNATGRVHGEWVRRPGTTVRTAAGYNLTAIAPGISWPGGRGEWGRNITGAHGKIQMELEEYDGTAEYVEESEGKDVKSAAVVRETSASVTMQDVGSGTMSWTMRLHGVHWPRQGAILLSTTSEKFAGIFGLPHLAPGPEFFQSSQKLLNVTLDEVLKRKEKVRFADPSNPWSSIVEGPDDPWALASHCEYVMYVQLYPLDASDTLSNNYHNHAKDGFTSLLDEMEKELRFPTGAPIKKVPNLKMSMVAWSPDCGYFLESKGPPLYPATDGHHLVGMKEEVFLYEFRMWILALAVIYMGKIWLLKTQMKETCTPSTIGRVSFYTAGLMLLADGIIFTVAAALSLATINTFLAGLLLTFSTFMSMTISGAFLSDVYKIQEPERRNRERNRGQSNNGATAPAATPTATPPPAAQGDGLPRPVTAPAARPTSPPIIIPSDQDIDAEIAEVTTAAAAVPTPGITVTAAAREPQVRTFASLTGRFVFLGMVIVFLSIAATSWPTPIRNFYVNALAFIYLSLWVPQIWRNIQRNSRRAFAWRFMIGQSVLRLAPFAYFYLLEDNIIFAEPDWTSFAVLAGWLWVQLWILAFQDVLGPRFGIPSSWAPEAWDYHPILREDNVEAGGLPIGLVGTFESAPGSPELQRSRSWSLTASEAGDGVRERERDKEREKKGTHIRSIDCAICREVLEVPVLKAGAADPTGGGVAGVLARRAYMVTPCRHIFHTKCLEGWLRFRLQCPICREELPPL
jgi:transmembrane E3 ubiquitin-protein ligase